MGPRAGKGLAGISFHYFDAYFIKHVNFNNLFINSSDYFEYKVIDSSIIMPPGGDILNHLTGLVACFSGMISLDALVCTHRRIHVGGSGDKSPLSSKTGCLAPVKSAS